MESNGIDIGSKETERTEGTSSATPEDNNNAAMLETMRRYLEGKSND